MSDRGTKPILGQTHSPARLAGRVASRVRVSPPILGSLGSLHPKSGSECPEDASAPPGILRDQIEGRVE
jgi:hypothetical protein